MFAKEKRPDLWVGARSGFQPGTRGCDAAFFRIYVHQNNVRADAPDAVPGDPVVVTAGAQTHQAAGPRYDEGADPPFGNLHLQILDEAQPLAGGDADHFFALQLGNLRCHTHHSHLVLVQPMHGKECYAYFS